MNKSTRSMMIWWIVIAGIVVLGIYQLFNRRDPVYQLATSDFHQYILKSDQNVFDGYLTLDEEWIEGRFRKDMLDSIGAEILSNVPPQERDTHLPPRWEGEFRASRDAIDDYDIQAKLDENSIRYNVEPPSKFPQGLLIFGTTIVPLLIFLGLMIFLSRQMQGSGNRALSFGKSRARLHSENQTKITFKDVAGVDEAKEALEEVIQFLKTPKKFERLGGRIPKGVLLMGPPGTGKTMLAKAVAGEADVPFYSISGSDFVEMFVGVGASRVRDLFELGKKNAPCIIFIDELDAVGRHRGAGIGGGHDEREQTLNQLLVEMQGFEDVLGVILIAATNRPDVLDPALLRPGRFDRQIVVDLPDVRGREAILNVHTKEPYKLAEDVNLEILAKATPGFSGADLENMTNEAALLAARCDKENIDMMCFDEAKDRVLMGPERRSLVISDEERRVTAYHEAGHALMLHFVPESDPNYKCTIVPRGRALGVTAKLPLEERHNMSKKRLLAHIIFALGGRVAEEIIFGEQTTGAQNDFEQATTLARRMVTQWGMSHMGPLTYGRRDEQVFLGKELSVHQDYSEKTAIEIDKAVHDIVTECYKKAWDILETNLEGLKLLADALLERETLVTEEIDEILGPPTPIAFKTNLMNCRGKTLTIGDCTHVMGILNVTPDSFSDGGCYLDVRRAIAHTQLMVEEGATLVDVGGESSRPGASPVSVDEELARVLPVIRAIVDSVEVLISVDTYKAEVARQALEAGAHLVNDITALRGDSAMASVVAEMEAGLILMHMKGTPRTMQQAPQYDDVVSEVRASLQERVRTAEEQGVAAERIIIDPGIGFGKTAEHNLELLKRLSAFRSLKKPLLIGTSRKSFIGNVLGLPVNARVEGTAATVCWAIAHGADIVRVHDVKANARAAQMTDALYR